MTTSTIATCDHGIVARTKRVIMDRDVYDKKWKLGPYAKKKEELKNEGKLDKYGRVVDKTPEAWKMLFGDSEKAVNINEVAAAVAHTVTKKDSVKAEPVKADDSDDEVAEKKRDKKKSDKTDKKDKKDKKEKKSKKTKKDDSDSD
jgi:H/ACA ribonucleoprotein complex subunit 4